MTKTGRPTNHWHYMWDEQRETAKGIFYHQGGDFALVPGSYINCYCSSYRLSINDNLVGIDFFVFQDVIKGSLSVFADSRLWGGPFTLSVASVGNGEKVDIDKVGNFSEYRQTVSYISSIGLQELDGSLAFTWKKMMVGTFVDFWVWQGIQKAWICTLSDVIKLTSSNFWKPNRLGRQISLREPGGKCGM